MEGRREKITNLKVDRLVNRKKKIKEGARGNFSRKRKKNVVKERKEQHPNLCRKKEDLEQRGNWSKLQEYKGEDGRRPERSWRC